LRCCKKYKEFLNIHIQLTYDLFTTLPGSSTRSNRIRQVIEEQNKEKEDQRGKYRSLVVVPYVKGLSEA